MSRPILCADIGSSSLKVALIGNSSTILGFVRQELAAGQTTPAATVWLSALHTAMQKLQQEGPIQPDAICISGNGPTLVAPGGETLLWSDPAVASSFPATKSLLIPRLLTFKTIYPELWKKIPFIFSGPEYIVNQLTGAIVTVLPEQRYSNAYWTTEELDFFEFSVSERAKLPPFIKPTDPAGVLHAAGARILRLQEGIPVFCGGPDFLASMIGTNTLKPGALCDRAGSSEGINFCTPAPVIQEGIRTLPSVMPGLWFADIIIQDSGSRFARYHQYIEKKLGYAVRYEELISVLIEKKYGSIPEGASGSAILSSIADQVGAAVKTLRKTAADHHFPPPGVMVLTGAQAHNKEWLQFKANTADISIAITSCSDAELAGDNIMARVGIGEYATIAEAADKLVKIEKIYHPAEG